LLAAREDIQRQIDRLLDSYARGLIDEETPARSLEPRKQQVKAINAELERFPAVDSVIDETTEATLIETARAIRERLVDPDALSVEEKQKILDVLDVQVGVERVARGRYIAHCTATLFNAASALRITSARSDAAPDLPARPAGSGSSIVRRRPGYDAVTLFLQSLYTHDTLYTVWFRVAPWIPASAVRSHSPSFARPRLINPKEWAYNQDQRSEASDELR
jgi:hypothetical protein